MNDNVIVTLFLYSKYSEPSKLLYQYLSPYMLPISPQNNIHSLCIDNANVRKQVLESKIQVANVPSIVLFYTSGVVQLFEGAKAFEWVNRNIVQIFSPPPPQPQHPPQHSHPPPQSQNPPQPQPQPQNPPQPQPHPPQPQHPPPQKTSIADIPQEEETENIAPQKKAESIRGRAEEMERERNAMFSKPPNGQDAMAMAASGIKPGGPTTNTVTNSIRQR